MIKLFKQQLLFQIDGYLSPVTKENTIARKTTRFRTFPDHLLIQLKKFDIDEKWQPYKVLGIIIGVINYHLSQTIVFPECIDIINISNFSLTLKLICQTILTLRAYWNRQVNVSWKKICSMLDIILKLVWI